MIQYLLSWRRIQYREERKWRKIKMNKLNKIKRPSEKQRA